MQWSGLYDHVRSAETSASSAVFWRRPMTPASAPRFSCCESPTRREHGSLAKPGPLRAGRPTQCASIGCWRSVLPQPNRVVGRPTAAAVLWDFAAAAASSGDASVTVATATRLSARPACRLSCLGPLVFFAGALACCSVPASPRTSAKASVRKASELTCRESY